MEEKSSKKEAIKLKRLTEMDTLWHPESTLVFKSSKEKRVIGRWIDKQFIELDDDALELTEKWGFKYDKELYDELYREEEIADDINGQSVCEEKGQLENTPTENPMKQEEKKIEHQSKIHTENTPNFVKCDMSHSSKLCADSCSVITESLKDIMFSSENFVKIINEKQKEVEELSEKHEELQKKYNSLREKFEKLRGIMSI